jgi:hypothetical protein
LEAAVRRAFFSEAVGSQQYSSGDLNECAAHLGIDHLDNCITQYRNYYVIELLFTFVYACPVLAYYWKRRPEFS